MDVVAYAFAMLGVSLSIVALFDAHRANRRLDQIEKRLRAER